MIDVIYDGPYEAVVGADGTVYPKGEPVPVPEEQADILIGQGFNVAPFIEDGNN